MALTQGTISRPAPGGIPLGGRLAALAWVLAAALTLACVAGFAMALLTGQDRLALARLGLGDPQVRLFVACLEVARLLTHVAAAAVIIWRRPRDLIALCAALILVAAGAFIPSAPEALGLTVGAPLPADFGVAVTGMVCFYLIFPDGRAMPTWGWMLVAAWLGWELLALLAPGSQANPSTWPAGLQFLRTMAWLGCGLAAQVYRYRRGLALTQRQPTRWVLYGAAVTYGSALCFVALPALFPNLRDPGADLTAYLLAGGALRTVLMLALPVSMAIAVLRYRLWGVDPIVSRTLAYGMLTLCVVAIYVLVVGSLSLLSRTAGNTLIALVATGVSALLAQPLQVRLQRAVNRLIYGERDDPYAALARLGQRLEGSLTLETILPALVETIAQAIRSPYVAIALYQDDALVIASEHPAQRRDQLADLAALHGVALTHQGELIGELRVAPRAPGEPLTRRDQRLIADLARQAGAALHALRLHQELQRTTDDLRQSRERLVSAREEERRRLRRDLHDGVGPTLASMVQRIDRARSLIPHDPGAADQALIDLKAMVKATLGDIRGLVYALRPPALDELGLVGAIRQHASGYAASDLRVTINAAAEPLILPAAVEVAAYRIALEALTNVARHARASACQLTLALVAEPPMLRIEVTDDGVGLAADRAVGVGLTAIGERVAELGGALVIEAALPRGTRLRAELPLPSAPAGRVEGGV